MTPDDILHTLTENNPEALVMEEYKDALVGIAKRCAQPDLLVYSYDKMVEIIRKAGASYEEAIDHIETNIVGAWMGPQTPIVIVCERTTAQVYDVPEDDLAQLEDGYFYWFPKQGGVNSSYLRFLADVLDAKNMEHDITLHRLARLNGDAHP